MVVSDRINTGVITQVHAPYYKITVVPGREKCTIHLSGEIDYAASLELNGLLREFLADNVSELDFDLGEVTLIDSEGIKVLAVALEQMQIKRGTAAIVNCSGRALRIIKLAGMEEMLKVRNCSRLIN